MQGNGREGKHISFQRAQPRRTIEVPWFQWEKIKHSQNRPIKISQFITMPIMISMYGLQVGNCQPIYSPVKTVMLLCRPMLTKGSLANCQCRGIWKKAIKGQRVIRAWPELVYTYLSLPYVPFSHSESKHEAHSDIQSEELWRTNSFLVDAHMLGNARLPHSHVFHHTSIKLVHLQCPIKYEGG